MKDEFCFSMFQQPDNWKNQFIEKEKHLPEKKVTES